MMSERRPSGSAGSDEVPTTPRAARWTGHVASVLQILSALFLLAAAVPKLTGTEIAVEAFDDIGAGQWLRVFTGVAEVAGAIGLLVPWITAVAAVGLAALMVGATVTNLFIVGDPGAGVTTLILLATFSFIAWRRLPDLDLRRLTDPLGRHQ